MLKALLKSYQIKKNHMFIILVKRAGLELKYVISKEVLSLLLVISIYKLKYFNRLFFINKLVFYIFQKIF
jgi:hypothetical protein